jgi:hypothetical protein
MPVCAFVVSRRVELSDLRERWSVYSFISAVVLEALPWRRCGWMRTWFSSLLVALDVG